MIKYIIGYTGPGYIAQNIKDAIDYYNAKSGIVVFAAGNSNSEADYCPAFAIPRPTTFRERATSARRRRYYDGTVAVAAVQDSGLRASFSNYGDWIEIAAPGVSVYSTMLGTSYGYASGTSMACPHIAGVLALGKAVAPSMPNSDLLGCMYSSAEDVDGSNGAYAGKLGAGLVDAPAFLACVGDSSDPVTTTTKPPVGDVEPVKDLKVKMHRKRVFRDAGKHEAEHEKFGLHLWYSVACGAADDDGLDAGAFTEDFTEDLTEAPPSSFSDKKQCKKGGCEWKKGACTAKKAESCKNHEDKKQCKKGGCKWKKDKCKGSKKKESKKEKKEAKTRKSRPADPEAKALADSQSVYDALRRFLDSDAHDGVVVVEPELDYATSFTPDDLSGPQSHYDAINLRDAWDLTTGDPNVVVQVLDTGIELAHPDLQQHLDEPGRDLRQRPTTASASRASPAATARDSGVKLAVSVGFGKTRNGGFAEALLYGADNGAQISSNSWGYTSPGVFSQSVLNAIDCYNAKSGIVVFAAGNENSESAYYPGYYEGAVAVAAVKNSGVRADFSNYGDWIEIAAPGVSVYSTLTGSTYGYASGTSMAAPHVAGVLALGMAVDPAFSRDDLLSCAYDTASPVDELNGGDAGKLGAGMVDAWKFVQCVKNDGAAEPPTAKPSGAVGRRPRRPRPQAPTPTAKRYARADQSAHGRPKSPRPPTPAPTDRPTAKPSAPTAKPTAILPKSPRPSLQRRLPRRGAHDARRSPAASPKPSSEPTVPQVEDLVPTAKPSTEEPLVPTAKPSTAARTPRPTQDVDDDQGWYADDDDDAYSYSYAPDDDLKDDWRPEDDYGYEWDDDWWKWDDDGHEWDDDWWKWDDDHGDEGGCCIPDEYSMEQGWYDDELFSKCPEHKTKKSCEPELAYYPDDDLDDGWRPEDDYGYEWDDDWWKWDDDHYGGPYYYGDDSHEDDHTPYYYSEPYYYDHYYYYEPYYYGDDDHGDEGGCCIPNEDAMERGWYDDELFSECPEHKTYKSCEPERGPTRACEWVENCGDDDWGWHDDDDDDAYSYSYTPDDDLDDTWRPDDDWSYEWDDDWWKWDDETWDDDWWKWDDETWDDDWWKRDDETGDDWHEDDHTPYYGDGDDHAYYGHYYYNHYRPPYYYSSGRDHYYYSEDASCAALITWSECKAMEPSCKWKHSKRKPGRDCRRAKKRNRLNREFLIKKHAKDKEPIQQGKKSEAEQKPESDRKKCPPGKPGRDCRRAKKRNRLNRDYLIKKHAKDKTPNEGTKSEGRAEQTDRKKCPSGKPGRDCRRAKKRNKLNRDYLIKKHAKDKTPNQGTKSEGRAEQTDRKSALRKPGRDCRRAKKRNKLNRDFLIKSTARARTKARHQTPPRAREATPRRRPVPMSATRRESTAADPRPLKPFYDHDHDLPA
ncbi:serine-type endopeptidase [Aureococcus anophagefferens]|nr:serine-type endopeptidase [Aureococcus anophagefferens]